MGVVSSVLSGAMASWGWGDLELGLSWCRGPLPTDWRAWTKSPGNVLICVIESLRAGGAVCVPEERRMNAGSSKGLGLMRENQITRAG